MNFMGRVSADNHSPPCDCCNLPVAALFSFGGFVLKQQGMIPQTGEKKWQL